MHIAAARQAVAAYQHSLLAHAAAAAHSAGHGVGQGAVHAAIAAGHGTIAAGRGAVHATPPHGVAVALQHYAAQATQGALALAFDDMFLVSTLVVGVAVLLAFTLRRHPQAAEDPADPAATMAALAA